MYLLATLLPLALLPLAYSAIQQPPLSTVTLYQSPASTSAPTSPKPLAILTYLPDRPYLSKIRSFTPPKNATISTADTDLTQIITYLEGGDGKQYRSSVTATVAFHAPAKGRFRLIVSKAGQVLGASWISWLPLDDSAAAAEGRTTGERGDFDLVMQRPAPRVVFDEPKGQTRSAGAGPVDPDAEPEPEKTMLQKYWWVLAAVALLAMTGSG